MHRVPNDCIAYVRGETVSDYSHSVTSDLRIEKLEAGYGSIRALHGVSLTVHSGQIVSVVGRNGAGKSTLLNAACGLISATSGSVAIGNVELTGSAPYQIAQGGLALVPEGRCVIAPLTVKENLELSKSAGRTKYDEMMTWVFDLFPRLFERKSQLAGSLSGGEQQMLAIGRALVTNPDFLLLDEPSMGLAPIVVDKVFESLIQINNQGIPMLLVEQDVMLASAVSDYMYVLHQGLVVAEGIPDELMNNEALNSAYLG